MKEAFPHEGSLVGGQVAQGGTVSTLWSFKTQLDQAWSNLV